MSENDYWLAVSSCWFNTISLFQTFFFPVSAAMLLWGEGGSVVEKEIEFIWLPQWMGFQMSISVIIIMKIENLHKYWKEIVEWNYY